MSDEERPHERKKLPAEERPGTNEEQLPQLHAAPHHLREAEKAEQERTLQAERLAAIGQTMTGLAHKARNNLQIIQANSERLSWRLHGDTDALNLIHEIQQALDALHQLYEDVRGYASPIVLDRRLCNLAAVWREVWAQMLDRPAKRDVRLTEEIAAPSLDCEIDAFQLGQVFRNVFENALAACADPVRVGIRCTETNLAGQSALRVAIRDNGPGLRAGQRQRIFDAFYTTRTHGTGLGMALARRIVEAHGGQIDVGESSEPGAEIIVLLPRRKP